tara:strand:- start:63263 stop:65173 length:1911 start_codon:yes stop_codon:yes gene_type:complete
VRIKEKKFQQLYRFFIDELLKSSWNSVLSLWKPMAGWTILVYLIFTALSAPVLFSMLEWSVFRGDRLFVGNEELIRWFFSPMGVTYLSLITFVILTGVVIRFAGLFQMVADDKKGNIVSVQATFLRVAPRIPVLLKICLITVAGFLLLLIPLLAGLGITYQLFLTEFDLNYYWYIRPPEWIRAITIGGIWAGLWTISSLILIACLLPALPSYLNGKRTLKESVAEVWKAPLDQTLRFLKVIGISAGGWAIFRFITDVTIFSIFFYLSNWAGEQFESLRPLAFIAGGYIFTTIVAGGVISFFGFSLVSTIISKFYFSMSRPKLMRDVPGFRSLTVKTLKYITWWAKPLRAGLLILTLMIGGFVTSIFIISEDLALDEGDRLMVIGHRANAGGAPENSLIALENSIELGVPIVEIDVQLTADSVVIVWHDEDLIRMTGDPRQIRNVRYEELQSLTLRPEYGPYRESVRVATLDQFLQQSKGRIQLIIELKYYGFYPALAEETVELIRKYEMEDQVLLKSLNYSGVAQLREIAPDLGVGYVSATAVGDISRLPVHFLSVYHPNITDELVRNSRERGMAIYAWTVNDREDMIAVIEKRVNGIITDYPEITLPLIEEINQLSAVERILLQFGLLVLENQSD